MSNIRPVVRSLVGMVVVLGTYGVWLAKSWQGQPVNPLVATIAILVTLMGARVVFGAGSLAKALDALSSIRDVQRASRDDQTESK